MPAPKKLVLTYVDSLRTDMLERAVAEGRAPTFGALLERGVLVPDCVSSFPSVTPVACAEMVTGVAADRHWISGMNWYHRLERRYVEYGSSLEATRSVGVFRALYDLVYNMNLAHLSPEVETLFERLDDAGVRTACTPFLIYRGRHRHQVSLEGLLKRAVETTRLKFRHHTWGPAELFYGDLYASREVPCKSTSIPGNRDGYSACCAAELERADGYDFLLLSLPDNDNYSHRHGPEASVESIARADDCFAELVEAGGGLDEFLADHAVILLADHAQTQVGRGLPLAELLGREWDVLAPSEDRIGEAQLAVSPTGRAAHVYLLPGEGPRAEPGDVRRRLGETEGVDLVCRLEDGAAVVEREGLRLRFSPGEEIVDLRGRRWDLEGDLAALRATVEDGVLVSDEYPDPLTRVHAALTAPNAGDFIVSLSPGYEAVDWGGVSHAGGGSHGALLAGDSLGPLLFVGCGPASADERKQWALRDVAPVVLDHFGLSEAITPGGARGRFRCCPLPRSPVRRRSRPPRRRRSRTAIPNVAKERRENGALTHSASMVEGHWEVAYFAGGKEVALVLVDPDSGQVTESWTGYQVALEDGARLLGRVRPQAQRALRLPAALRAVPARAGRLAPAAGGSRRSICWSCWASASPTTSSTGPRSASRCRSPTRRCSTCWRGRCGSGCGEGGRGSGRSGRRPGCSSPRCS